MHIDVINATTGFPNKHECQRFTGTGNEGSDLQYTGKNL